MQMAVHHSDDIPMIDTTFGQRVGNVDDRGLVYLVDECVTPSHASIYKDHAFWMVNQIGEDGSLAGLGRLGVVLGQHDVGQGKTLDSRKLGEPCHSDPFLSPDDKHFSASQAECGPTCSEILAVM